MYISIRIMVYVYAYTHRVYSAIKRACVCNKIIGFVANGSYRLDVAAIEIFYAIYTRTCNIVGKRGKCAEIGLRCVSRPMRRIK